MYSQTFDLNVKNYSLTELQSFFNMTADNDQPLKDKCMILKKKINQDPKLGPTTKEKMFNFLDSALIILNESGTPSMLYQNLVNNNELIPSKLDVPPLVFSNNVQVSKPKIKKALNIDTRFRQNYYSTKSTDFVFNIPYKFENVVTMSVATYELPLTYYAVSQQHENNCMLFQWESQPRPLSQEPVFDSQYTLMIPDGNYRTSFQMGGGSIIENTINALLAGTQLVKQTGMTFVVDQTSGRSIFSCNSSSQQTNKYYGAIKIAFNVVGSIDRTASSASEYSSFQNDVRGLPYFLGWSLGYRSAVYEMRGNGTSTLPQSAVSEGVCLITGPLYVFMCIDDYNNNVNNYYVSSFASSTLSPNVIARLNIKHQLNTYGAYGITAAESLATSLTYSRDYFGPVDIQRLRITLIDDFGRVLDLNNMDWSFSLLFECLHSNPQVTSEKK